jgi:hypothetical protein
LPQKLFHGFSSSSECQDKTCIESPNGKHAKKQLRAIKLAKKLGYLGCTPTLNFSRTGLKPPKFGMVKPAKKLVRQPGFNPTK